MLTLKSITVRISAYTILRGLQLQVPTGAVVGLVGRNGAGKTTTLRAIMGLVPLDRGEILLDERDLGALPPHHRAKLGMGYMPEDRRLIEALSVEENLLIPAQASGTDDVAKRLADIYSMLPEVKAVAKRKAIQLSGGQQKLVALARSFVNGRRLLLLDEPFEGVSTALSRRLAKVIHAFQQKEKGLSVLVAESDVKRAAMLTDQVRLIERGEALPGRSFQTPMLETSTWDS